MKILSANQIRQIDAYTIDHEPIASLDLMERACQAFVRWFVKQYDSSQKITVVCGLGNNGGDGLAIARLLSQQYKVTVYIVRYAEKTSDDFAANFIRLGNSTPVYEIQSTADVPVFNGSDILIDAIFGSGLNRPVERLVAQVIYAMNQVETILAIDIPSGLFADAKNQSQDSIVKASHTVSFQLPKLAFMLPQNAELVGEWHLVGIGLHPEAIDQAKTRLLYTTETQAHTLLRRRSKFSHKGTNGHALLIAGSSGMMGAAILSARACLRSGVGKLSVHAPGSAKDLIQLAVPEAIFSMDDNVQFSTNHWTSEDLNGFASIGIGPGLGVNHTITESIKTILDNCGTTPLVMDADALNNLSTSKGRDLLARLPPSTILTPHPREFQKLLNQDWKNDYEKLDLLANFATQNQLIVCLKGAHTAVALPDGEIHFNSTGNPGMATGGTGDVLTGVITALLAQKYPPVHAAILGVYLHGLAGDLAAKHKSIYAMMASDLYEYLPDAFLQLTKPEQTQNGYFKK